MRVQMLIIFGALSAHVAAFRSRHSAVTLASSPPRRVAQLGWQAFYRGTLQGAADSCASLGQDGSASGAPMAPWKTPSIEPPCDSRQAVRRYTYKCDGPINRALKGDIQELNKTQKVFAETILLGMWAYGALPPPTVYRATHKVYVREEDVGHTLEFKAFTSTAKDRVTTRRFLNDPATGFEGKCPQRFTIHLDPQRSGARDITLMSQNRLEGEVLFPPRSVFKVESFERMPYPMSGHEIVLREVPCQDC